MRKHFTSCQQGLFACNSFVRSLSISYKNIVFTQVATRLAVTPYCKQVIWLQDDDKLSELTTRDKLVNFNNLHEAGCLRMLDSAIHRMAIISSAIKELKKTIKLQIWA